MTLSAAQMRSLPEFFHSIDDPRRRQGRRHALPTVLALATAATLCGMRGYQAISEWVEDRCRIRTGHGPENMTRLRRFAIGLIKNRGLAVAETMRRLARNPRRVLDFLKMTANTVTRAAPA